MQCTGNKVIKKIGIPSDDITSDRLIKVPDEVERVLSYFVKEFLRLKEDPHGFGLRDDHACLLVWTIKLIGLPVTTY